MNKSLEFGVWSLEFVTRPGFEPRQTESESVVLPLHHRAILGEQM